MTSAEIRQSFLDFFKEKKHTLVPSASLMPTSPNLLFTNAGMNQFIPYFLGTEKAPYHPPRAAHTQKCIRAGGKHNDLEDVGYDTYHHTFFEMHGNWSFGDYFKEEAIEWAWELLVDRWGFPPARLYATVYKPGPGDPSALDQDAYDHWRALFERAGLDPQIHIVDGNVKDNFWMMGDTGPCGPCSEIHVDLTEKGDTRGALVNAGDARCIEIWNLVFIQYNAETDGSYRPLPARHVDTGMGFERACAVIQATRGFKDFSKLASNYDTDVFAPIFTKLEELSGHRYHGTLPSAGNPETGTPKREQQNRDVALRVIADHIRTLSFSIADGILPGNTDRNYVLRRILRRAVRYGRQLGLGSDGKNFLPALVPVLVEQFGPVFPELAERQSRIEETLDTEETSFNRTLGRGIVLFNQAADRICSAGAPPAEAAFPAETAFELYDTFGFPADLTALMAAERGLTLDLADVETHMAKQRERARAAHTQDVVKALEFETDVETTFVGYERDTAVTRIQAIVDEDDRIFAIVDTSPFYVEMGGQVGDTGTLATGGETIRVLGAVRFGAATALELERVPAAWRETPLDAKVAVDAARRRNIESHHTATHILHWALHEAVSPEAAQQGSFVGPDRLRFDFNSKALTRDQLDAIEKLANEKIAADDPVTWTEVRHADIANRKDIMQFFGVKYGDQVRVVQIGGKSTALDGYSMELCGGTHVRRTGSIGRLVIRKEEAIAAGIRRIEALCGDAAEAYLKERRAALQSEITELTARLVAANQSLGDRAIAIPAPAGANLAAHRDALTNAAIEAEKTLKKSAGANLAAEADARIAALIAAAAGDPPALIEELPGADPDLLQELLGSLKKQAFPGIAVLAIPESDKVHLAIYVAAERTKDFQAGKLMAQLAPIVGGRGGGKPEHARGAGTDPSKTGDLLAKARELLG